MMPGEFRRLVWTDFVTDETDKEMSRRQTAKPDQNFTEVPQQAIEASCHASLMLASSARKGPIKASYLRARPTEDV